MGMGDRNGVRVVGVDCFGQNLSPEVSELFLSQSHIRYLDLVLIYFAARIELDSEKHLVVLHFMRRIP